MGCRLLRKTMFSSMSSSSGPSCSPHDSTRGGPPVAPWEELCISNAGGFKVVDDQLDADGLTGDSGSNSPYQWWNSSDVKRATPAESAMETPDSDAKGAVGHQVAVEVLLNYSSPSRQRPDSLATKEPLGSIATKEALGSIATKEALVQHVESMPVPALARTQSNTVDPLLNAMDCLKSQDASTSANAQNDSCSQDDLDDEQTWQEFFQDAAPDPSGRGSHHQHHQHHPSSISKSQHHPLKSLFSSRRKKIALVPSQSPSHLSTAPHRQSAASYYNRQASLLMLYLPLAYIVVFGFSLVRLIYDMVTQKPNAGLNVVSLWFVMSVGLIDALIYVSRPLLFFSSFLPWAAR